MTVVKPWIDRQVFISSLLVYNRNGMHFWQPDKALSGKKWGELDIPEVTNYPDHYVGPELEEAEYDETGWMSFSFIPPSDFPPPAGAPLSLEHLAHLARKSATRFGVEWDVEHWDRATLYLRMMEEIRKADGAEIFGVIRSDGGWGSLGITQVQVWIPEALRAAVKTLVKQARESQSNGHRIRLATE